MSEQTIQKYTILDENGIPQAFYSSEIHQNIPSNAIPITHEQWLELISNQGQRKFNTQTNEVEPFDPQSLISFEELKTQKTQTLIRLFTSLIQLTDYIITKIKEAELLNPNEVQTLIQNYQPKLTYRTNLRNWYENKLSSIQATQTKEELNEISLNDYPQET
jgi:hypothetical protein